MRKTIYSDHSEHWESLFRCRCGGHMLSVDRWKDFPGDDQVFLNFWFDEGGDYCNNTLWNRIKNAWSVLWRGGHHKAEIIMDPKDMIELCKQYNEYEEDRKNVVMQKELHNAADLIIRLLPDLNEGQTEEDAYTPTQKRARRWWSNNRDRSGDEQDERQDEATTKIQNQSGILED